MTARHVYVHVPFCARRCSYCDFAIAVRRAVPVNEFVAALQIELRMRESGGVDTIYFGGGTPSLLGAEGVARALDVVRARHEPDADAEITLEANPEDVTPPNARAWLTAGVNRISIGTQSFDDRVLRWMHRVHDAMTAQRAVRIAREAGFHNVSLDLIFALPTELERDWKRDLDVAIELRPNHLSLYGLTIEPATPLARWQDRGAVAEAPDERYEAEFLAAHDAAVAAGYDHYEVSNFALNGHSSRHNQAYWSGVAYHGYGPSAHRFDGTQRAWNQRAYANWVRCLNRGEDPMEASEVLTPEQRELESVYLGLRTRSGVPVSVEDMQTVAAWEQAGWADATDGRVTLNPLGWLRLDALVNSLTVSGSLCKV
jgi:oxygen-independent coproporphyrinogen-3 oxidase